MDRMLTDVTTMGEEFLYCGKVSFQNNDTSYLTETACESDDNFDGNIVAITSSNQSAYIMTHLCNA